MSEWKPDTKGLGLHWGKICKGAAWVGWFCLVVWAVARGIYTFNHPDPPCQCQEVPCVEE